jgi:hypothetical protein
LKATHPKTYSITAWFFVGPIMIEGPLGHQIKSKNVNFTAFGLIRPDLLLISEENGPCNFHRFQNCDFAAFEPWSYGNHKK